VVEREPAQGTGITLTWALERDYVEPGDRDPLPDGVELLDQRVEPAVDDYRSAEGVVPVRVASRRVMRRPHRESRVESGRRW
jgi:hypothetical protein